MTRTLVYEDTRIRRFEIRDGAGTLVGYDTESIPTAEQDIERTVGSRVDAALVDLRLIANSTGPLTVSQMSNAVRVCARVLIGLLRLERRLFDAAD